MPSPWIDCTIIGWQKLSHKCDECGKPNAEIEFRFKGDRLPKPYLKGGEGTVAWHMQCLPPKLAIWFASEEQSWIETLQTPPGANHD